MSIIDLQRDLESFPDQALAQESKQPSGQYPLYLVAAEIQRRADLRERFANQQAQGKAVQPPVLDQRLAQMGLGGAPQMAPQMGGGMQGGPPMGGGMPGPQGPPQGAPRGFQTGGRVSIADLGVPESAFRASIGIDRRGNPLDSAGIAAAASPYSRAQLEAVAERMRSVQIGHDRRLASGMPFSPEAQERSLESIRAAEQFLRDNNYPLPDRLPDRLPEGPSFANAMHTPPPARSPLAMAGPPGIASVGGPGSALQQVGQQAQAAMGAMAGFPGNMAARQERLAGQRQGPMFQPMAPGQTEPGPQNVASMVQHPDAPPGWQLDLPRLPEGWQMPDMDYAAMVHGDETTLTPDQRALIEQRARNAMRMAQWTQRLQGIPEEVEAQLETLGQNEGAIQSMIRQGEEGEAGVLEAQQAQAALVDEFAQSLEQQSAVEKALAASAKSPAELARERKNRAFAQLGSLIGSARQVGDVATGLGGINESIYQMRREQDAEQNDIQMALAGAKDARERQRRMVMIEQGGRDVAAAIGSLDRANARMQAAISARSLTANAAAQLLNTLQSSIGALARMSATGTGAMDTDQLLETINTMRQLREEVRTGRIEGLDPEEQQATTDLLFRIDSILQDALSDDRLAWSSEGLAGAAGQLDALVREGVAGMGGR